MIRTARINGTDVFADQGEDLRGKDVVCKFCGAKMHVHRLPGKNEYFFALNPGEEHTRICKNYDGAKDAPVLIGITPDELIALICTPSKKRERKHNPEGEPNDTKKISGKPATVEPKGFKPRRLTKVSQFINTGVFFENPFAEIFPGIGFRYIDFIIYGKDGKYIWKDQLVNIGSRVIDARWVGSFNLGRSQRVIETMKRTREVWFSQFWRKNEGGYESVRFCLDATSCFSDMKRKLFGGKIEDNGAYGDFIPKGGEKLDVLIAARWAVLTKEQCKEICPLNGMCKNCKGAYWGKINTVKQIELFPVDEQTKTGGSENE